MEHYVNKNHLAEFLAREQDAGNDVTLVEPKRSNLEEFFLQTVKGE
jgi:hypothetical protein